MNSRTKVKNNIAEVSKQKGIETKAELSRQSGFTPAQVSNWWNNKQQPSGSTLVVLAKVLKCKIDDLIEEVK